jgi:hypothetical protein
MPTLIICTNSFFLGFNNDTIPAFPAPLLPCFINIHPNRLKVKDNAQKRALKIAFYITLLRYSRHRLILCGKSPLISFRQNTTLANCFKLFLEFSAAGVILEVQRKDHCDPSASVLPVIIMIYFNVLK